MEQQNIEDIYPLSPMQQGMLFHSILDQKGDVYTGYTSCKLYGDLDVSALKRAWQRVVAHHPILRSSFVWEDMDEPLQVVHQQVEVPFSWQDWRNMAPAEQENQLHLFLEAERRKGFDLVTAPLLRIGVIQLDDTVHQFIWMHHHLLLDGWTLPLILKDVFALYEAFRLGKDIHLMPVRPFRDYIAWLQEQDLARAETFWRQLLKGFINPNSLVVDQFPGPARDPVVHSLQEIKLSTAYTEKLQALARQHQLTVNTFVQGAWALLLSRYSGDADIVFGATVSGRPAGLKGVENMVGLFINTLPVRIKISHEQSILDWLKQIQTQQIQERQYEFTPLVQIHGWSEVPRDLSLFESILVFENYPVSDAMKQHEGSLKIQEVRSLEQTNYPITVVAGVGLDLTIKISYDNKKFGASTISRMLSHLKTILEGMVGSPGQPVVRLPLLTVSEQRQLLVEWNNTRRDHPGIDAKGIHAYFEDQVERNPGASAVVFQDFHLTYQELNDQANQLAHYLKKFGVASNVPVGIYLDRSPAMVTGLLGVLKAGAAYLPLDPTYPGERLKFMLENSKTPVLITQKRFVDELPVNNIQYICLDSDWQKITLESKENPAVPYAPENLAYVIYTSGSTGAPKGVMISHRSLVNHALCLVDIYQMQPGDRILQFISLSFDAAAEELFPTLISGATMVLHPEAKELQGSDFLRFYQRQSINILHLPVPFWHQLVDDLSEKSLPITAPPKVTLVGGDSPAIDKLNTWKRLTHQNSRFINAYGPTETTITATAFEIGGSSTKRAEYYSLPIGHPIANVQVYILDSMLRPVPIGVPGELFIGGMGLATGYLNRPDLTAERFIANPFSDVPGARIYKTGDLVRYLADGNIQFLGRMDNQVKIRGFRVELEEIERAIKQYASVSEAAVLARQDVPGTVQLVAYIVTNAGMEISDKDLRTLLKVKLPEYMIPSIFILLEALPLLPNGKIDRKALPAPESDATKPDQGFVAPRTPVEELVASIWCQVLRRDRVGCYDNFFDLGGHSLMATQLMSRIRETFNIELPLRTIFEIPTVARLAETIEAAVRSDSGLTAPPIKPIAREEDVELPLSFAQQRLWFLDQLAPGSTFYNIPTAVRLTGKLNLTVLEQSINEIVRRHEALRTTFIPVNGTPVQIIEPVLELRLEPIYLRDLSIEQREAEARRIAVEETQKLVDLEQGPLFRVQLLQLDEEEHVALLTMHHIISDGWSVGLLIQEVAVIYNAFSENRPSPLPELPVQYADFAHWQRQWLQGEVMEMQIAYWKEKLGGSPAVLELPLDRPRPAIQSFHGSQIPIKLAKGLSNALHALIRQESVTTFMMLLAAFQTLLYRYSGQMDICVGSPIANRNRSEIEGLIGFFVNTLVLRTDFSGNPTFREVLARVRETALAAYAHQDLPFEKLVEVLQPQRDLSHTPLFQVMFVLQNNPIREMKLSGLQISPFTAGTRSAQFDVTLTLSEGDDGFLGSLEYNTDLFDAVTIQRISEHFQVLLEAIVAEPDQPVTALPIMTQAERLELLMEWNDAAVDSSAYDGKCFHQLFEEQVEKTPEAPAVVFEEQKLTYRELNRRSNQVAHYLQKLGVGPEVLVGICTERSIEMIVGVMGILKAGGAYIPLDPTYPAERLAYMLADSQTPVLLTQQHLATGLVGHGTRIVLLDADWEVIAKEQDINLDSGVAEENLAYVIYTSGSTGKPKGVMLRHRGMCNLSEAQLYAFDIGTGNNVLQFSSFSFDASVWEMIMALRAGATFHLARQEQLVPGAEMIQLLKDRKINTVTLPPSILAVLPENELVALNTIVAAGEALPGELVNKWSSGRRFFNAYGPTEVTVCGSYHLCNGVYRGSPPIGRAIANAQLYVLDHYLNPVSVGVPGELLIGGTGLARGYLNRPDLTAAKFIPHPFSDQSGARLYKTGDLVRYLPGGEIEFLGRIDHQVKVRGFRIELGEIEAVLVKHPAIRDSVVLAREDEPGDKRLVAYIITEPGATPGIGELRKYLNEQVPDYMVPSAFVMMTSFPLTPNGKIDRQALPAPDKSRMQLEKEYVAPRNQVEEKLAEICAQILTIERVGIYDNFFELGGHSLLATQFIARVRDAFNVDLPLRNLFEKPNIAELAEDVMKAQESGITQKVPEIKRVARDVRRVQRSELSKK